MTREEAIDLLDNLIGFVEDSRNSDYDTAFKMGIKALEQEPKTGHWEWVQYDYDSNIGNWHCSECKNIAVVGVKKNEEGGIPIYKYCPNCGAKMVETQESEE